MKVTAILLVWARRKQQSRGAGVCHARENHKTNEEFACHRSRDYTHIKFQELNSELDALTLSDRAYFVFVSFSPVYCTQR